jgi:fructosamine-3-kinase
MGQAEEDRLLLQSLGDLLQQEVKLGPLVGGGSIHRSQTLLLPGGERLFLKVCAADRHPLLKAEVEGLRALAAAIDPTAPLVIPTVRACAQLAGQAVLVLSWLPLAGSRPGPTTDLRWRAFGAALAHLHRRSAADPALVGRHDGFGWVSDNWIGTAPQSNHWDESWITFFAEQRLAPQLAWAARQGRPFSGAEALLSRVPRLLADHQPPCCLVHGDLWAGNGGLLADGRGTVFDPAVHWADREVDLAMAALFGGFPEAFFEGYDASWPRPSGHLQRSGVYNLYHLLNHANLFGGGYWRQAQSMIRLLLETTI